MTSSYVLVRISTRAPNQNLSKKIKNLGYLNFSTTATKCGPVDVFSLFPLKCSSKEILIVQAL